MAGYNVTQVDRGIATTFLLINSEDELRYNAHKTMQDYEESEPSNPGGTESQRSQSTESQTELKFQTYINKLYRNIVECHQEPAYHTLDDGALSKRVNESLEEVIALPKPDDHDRTASGDLNRKLSQSSSYVKSIVSQEEER